MSPTIKIWKEFPDSDYPHISQSKMKRDWMDETYKNVAYKCPPMNNATVHGWEVRLPHDVKIIWNGKWKGIDGEQRTQVQILEGEYYQGNLIVSTDPGVGTITFLLNILAETDKNHYLVMSGPPNYIFPDAEPLSVVWRSDYYNYNNLSSTWKINTANKEVVFPKNMPICFFTIYEKNLLESTTIEIHSLKNNPDLLDYRSKYAQKRSDLLQKDPENFPQLYKHGIGVGNDKFIDSPWKIVLKDPVIKY